MIDLTALFHPRSVAVIGATDQLWGGGGMILNTLTKNHFPGKIYPIHPREKQLAGLPVYRDVFEVPGEIDLAVIAIPARAIPTVIRQCHDKGIKFAAIHSSGFSELNEEGKRLEAEMVAVAASGHPRIIGPNCMGIYAPASGLNTVVTYVEVPHETGPVSFVGQSGWGTENFTGVALDHGLLFSKVVSIGNQSDLTVEDLLEDFSADSDTRVIGIHIEGAKKPREFLELIARTSPRKPVVVWKASRTEASARAATSHTGSMATNNTALEAGLRQNGAISVTGLKELVDVTAALSSPVLPKGNRVGLLVSSGGTGIACCDAIAASNNLKLAAFPEDAQKKLRDYIGTLTGIIPNVSNPVDLGWLPTWGSFTPYIRCFETMFQHCDMALLQCFMPLNQDLLQALKELRDNIKKPIIVVPGHPVDQKEGIAYFTRNGLPACPFPEDAIRAMAAMWQYARWKQGIETER